MAEHSDPMAALRYAGWSLGVDPKHGAVEVLIEPCPYCAVWIGPHRHWLREDGSLGLIVEEPRTGRERDS